MQPRRGIRYGKARPKGSVKAAANARVTAAAARAARKGAGEAVHRHERYEDSEEQMGHGAWSEDADLDMDDYAVASRPSSDPLPPPLKPTSYSQGGYSAPQPLGIPPPPTSSAPSPLPSQEDSAQMLANALASVIPGFSSMNSQGVIQPLDPMVLHQQLAAMSAAAQAAQQAFVAAKATMAAQTVQPQPYHQPKPVEGVARPLFHIRAVAGPPMEAPRYEDPMQEDAA